MPDCASVSATTPPTGLTITLPQHKIGGQGEQGGHPMSFEDGQDEEIVRVAVVEAEEHIAPALR